MIRLDTTTRTLEIILTTAQTTNPIACAVCYSDDSPGVSYTGGSKLTSSNGVTAATICLAPAAGVTRDIDFISVYNADTAQKQATIRINDNGTFYSLVDVVMNVDDRLEYTHGSGWKLTDINGQTKQTFIGGSMTSAQLAAIISDETGTGSLVFATGGAIAPASINGVPTDSTVNKVITETSINSGSFQASFVGLSLSVANSVINRNLQNGTIALIGGTTSGVDAGIALFGSTSALPNRCYIDTSIVTFRNISGLGTYAVIDTNGISATGAVSATTTIRTGGYTVATLPAGTTGDTAYVTDAVAPTYKGALTGGGTVVTRVFKNTTAWESS